MRQPPDAKDPPLPASTPLLPQVKEADRGCVVIAPDKFKGTLTAGQVAAHVAAGLGRARLGLKTVQVPVADGGDGTVDAAQAAGYRRIEIGVRGPTGKPVTASFALLDDTAIIESASASSSSPRPGCAPSGSCSAWAVWPAPTEAPAWSPRSAAGWSTSRASSCRRAGRRWPGCAISTCPGSGVCLAP